MDWYDVKLWLSDWSGLEFDALHVHAGVLAQLTAAFLLRRSLASPWSWILVLILALGNEWWDLAYEVWPDRDEQYAESMRDVWNTMLLPTILLLVGRFAPRRMAGDADAPEIADRVDS